jgi:hypothetical protein
MAALFLSKAVVPIVKASRKLSSAELLEAVKEKI